MISKYREVPYWWYLSVLTFAFSLGIIVTTTQKITMPVWSYFIALALGAFVAPFVSRIFHAWLIAVDHLVLSIRKWYRDQQLDENRMWDG